MKASIAVATVSGKTYYLLVNELRQKNVQFISLTPNEPIPMEIKAVITTEGERHLIDHEKVLVYRDGEDPEALIENALQVVHGKGFYERLVIGVDPGEVFGLAVLADGRLVETENCFSVAETIERINSIIRNLGNSPITSASVRIGDGVRAFKEELLRALDSTLPQGIILESVSETGTSRTHDKAKHRRGLRDIASAIKIAGRNGRAFQRRRENESDS
jgi:hypothetical protein